MIMATRRNVSHSTVTQTTRNRPAIVGRPRFGAAFSDGSHHATASGDGPATRRIGIIDVGSNTSRLIILAYRPGMSFRLIDQIREQVRLGEGMGAENVLRPEPIERTVRLLRVFRGLCEADGIHAVVAVGTSAVRDARNQGEFLKRVKNGAGLSLRVLSGDEEARYGFLGAVNSLAIQNGLAVDLGGGSLELVRVQDRRPQQSVMLPAGAVRLTEAFLREDPPRAVEIRTLTRYLEYLLRDLPWVKAGRGDSLVGSGGTIRTLAKIDQRLQEYPLDRVHGYILSRRRLEEIVQRLAKLPLRKRRKFPGLSSDRADVTLAGALALASVLERSGHAELVVSGQGLREGIFYEHFLRETGTDTIEDPRAFGIANLSLLYDLNWPHARHVEALAVSLFDQLRPLHGYGPPERATLSAAALLHDLGLAIDYYSHHEYSSRILLDADLPGFRHREVALMSQLVLYHRRGTPRVQPFPGLLTSEDDDRIRRLGGLLRLAEYLDRSRTQVIQGLRCRIRPRAVTLECLVRGDASTELWATERKSDLFQEAFRRGLILRMRRISARPPSPRPAQVREAPLWLRMREVTALTAAP
jgi:exopolyphosphatase/guanosine-5'-triphosphate,3'-diphosphate pyrophosphatase